MQTFECIRQAFVVSRQTTETRHPAKIAFDHSSSRQQHESLLGFRQLDYFQAVTLFFSRLARLFAAVPLVDKGAFHRFTRGILNRLSQLPGLNPVLLIG